jgi:hypothetical protein
MGKINTNDGSGDKYHVPLSSLGRRWYKIGGTVTVTELVAKTSVTTKILRQAELEKFVHEIPSDHTPDWS